MFKWLEDLLDSNNGQGRKKECCGCGCEKPVDEILTCSGSRTCNMPGTPTYTCTMPEEPTSTPEEESKEPFTVTMYLASGGDPIKVENVIDWEFFEDVNTGRVSIDVYFKEDKDSQVFMFMRDQLSYVTAI